MPTLEHQIDEVAKAMGFETQDAFRIVDADRNAEGGRYGDDAFDPMTNSLSDEGRLRLEQDLGKLKARLGIDGSV